MAPRKSSKKSKQTQIPTLSPDIQNILIGVFFLTLGIIVFFSTQTQIDAATGLPVELPTFGKFLQTAGIFLFWQYFRFIFSPIFVIFGGMLITQKTDFNPTKLLGILGFFISATSLFGWYTGDKTAFFNLFDILNANLGKEVTILFLLVLFFGSLYAVFHISYAKILTKIATTTKNSFQNMKSARDEEFFIEEKIPEKNLQKKSQKAREINAELEEIQNLKKPKIFRNVEAENEEKIQIEPMGAKILKNFFKKDEEKSDENFKDFNEEEILEEKNTGKNLQKNVTKKPAFIKSDKKIPLVDASGQKIESKNIFEKNFTEKNEEKIIKNSTLKGWKFPSLELLDKPRKQNPISPAEIREKALIIQKTLLQFGIEVEMEEECVGPTVIQYRLRPAEGVKVAKIESLNKDLALALGAKSIRIEAPIPGMQLVGIEVPNDKRDMISIYEVLSQKDFVNNTKKYQLPVAMGKDINGQYIYGDLHAMPHLLVAGQTGSGKSVGMNGLILSLLYQKTPAELQMIMVDPKQVELGMYDGIPHLMTPVITSPDKALNALKWDVAEMERRYGVMKEARVKNIVEYNNRVGEKEKWPFIVFIIDELADLMMSGNKKEVETQIARIAQKWRAAGMHIIIATQRPSVNVITGMIKANIPSRIAFTVTSQIDSRTILDQMGAESLLGKGDMLYWANGAMYATRVQGMFVDTDEIDNVVRDIRLTPLPNDWEPNVPDIGTIPTGGADLGNFTGGIGMPDSFDEDPKIIEQAIEIVQSAGKCSTSMLQRHMGLGYGRAAKVVDIMEEMGVVGPANGSKPREVLM